MRDQAVQIFKRNKESQSKSERNVLDMIKDVFDEMAAVRADRDEAVRTLALARASTDEDEDADAYLDSVDADEDAEFEAFLGELYSPSK